jgi:serine/threonine protein kinase
MSTSSPWTETRSLPEVRAADLGRDGVVFRHGNHLYRTTGEHLNEGGMGAVYIMERCSEDGMVEPVVGKTFHAQYLYQLRTDEITRRDHETNLHAMALISQISHPNLLPIYVSSSIADNHLLVSPRMGDTLHEAVARGLITARQRVKLLIEALKGLRALHECRLVHRDLTLRNIILDSSYDNAFLFDFDLAMNLDEVLGVSYQSRYQGRVFGSPGFSVPPEIVDAALMESAITPRLDIYAIGGAIFSLFTDRTPHGPTDDMWGLLMRIAEGVVFSGVSRVVYPDQVPVVLRPVIEGCLERDPGDRFGSVGLVIRELEKRLDDLDDTPVKKPAFHVAQTLVEAQPDPRRERVEQVHSELGDNSVTRAVIELVDVALSRYGYQVRRSLGRIRGNAIFIATPAPELVATGQFPDTNTYPKVVTAINLHTIPNPQELLDLWFGHYLPVLKSVRQGLFTNLYRVVYDDYTGHLFLFSELVVDPRFGTDLYEHDLSLIEALGLGFLLVRQVGQLHEHGLAHNNIRPESLLIKGLEDTRDIRPCMVGLVQPSIQVEAIRNDVRNLASLILSWIKPANLVTSDQRVRTRVDQVRSRLAALAFNESSGLGIDELLAIVADALSAVDYNFGVLREHRGDLQDYVLLQVSHRLYGRLWSD